MTQLKSPRQTLSKAYLKSAVTRTDMEQFKTAFGIILDKVDTTENEEHLKNLIRDFLLDAFYKGLYEINVKDRKDLVIHNGPKSKDDVAVIIEAKSVKNKAEMVSKKALNKKALQELILYYLREREDKKNISIKHLIITNAVEWFVFDENDFEKLIFRNTKFLKQYKEYTQSGKDTKHFYESIAKPFIETIKDDLSYTWFDISRYEKIITNDDKIDDKKLVALFKLLSPVHILKKPFANDSNSLNRNFYNELLHIIGLEETKEKNKKVIKRRAEGKRDPASLLENTINILKYETSVAASLQYETALELCITWINRVLFLKLLESQLIKYHKGDKSFQFLNSEKIQDYDTLNRLFFQVLAIRPEDRRPRIKEEYSKVPYLNSSLFEVNALESKTLKISNLEERDELPLYSKTVLRDSKGKREEGSLKTLDYLFQFLEAYNFSSEGSEQIQEENKSLINASVLGLIFEKINGYKDGSFFTPGFITMYMSKETLQRAVLQKFKEHTDFESDDWDELRNYIGRPYKKSDLKLYNDLIDSIKICDPAVGSGHFLVSALNEMIAIKSELGILTDDEHSKLPVMASVDNDELIIQEDNEDLELYEYDFGNPESQRVQKALFNQKQRIIENCLFGVDINPNSVKICRLRLWIELLKHAYYTPESKYSDLETLPNIDINIKCGNSLVSRFALDSDLGPALKKSKFTIDSYKIAVASYKDATNKEEKNAFKQLIENVKTSFRSEVAYSEGLQLRKLEEQFYNRFGTTLLDVELSKAEAKKKEKAKKTLMIKIDKKKTEIDEIKHNKIYEDAFEWRFEFPEVLDDDGTYVGFDVVIGNPPYFSLTTIPEESKYLARSNFSTYSRGADIYCVFYERGIQILREKGHLTYITSNSWLRSAYGKELIDYLNQSNHPIGLIVIDDVQIFEEATVESNIMTLQKGNSDNKFIVSVLGNDFPLNESLYEYANINRFPFFIPEGDQWLLERPEKIELMKKVSNGTKLLRQFEIKIYRGILTGCNPAFIISDDKYNSLIQKDGKNSQILKPILRGRDLTKYSYSFGGMYLINSHNGNKKTNLEKIDLENNYPDIFEHLVGFLPQVKKRYDQGGHWSNLRNCAYLHEFEKPKIVWGEIADEPKFAYDDNGYFAEATTFVLTGEKLKYLLAILNSKLSKWYFNLIGTTTGMGTNRWEKYKIEQLPIKEPTVVQERIVENKVDEIILAKSKNRNTTILEVEIDLVIYKLYGLNYNEVLIIDPDFEMNETDYFLIPSI